MRRKFLLDLSASSLQLLTNQVCGLGIFYSLSLYFSKNDFGKINWSLAVLLTVFSVLSAGMDQVMVKKIAAGEDPGRMLSVYFFHVIISGTLFYTLLGVAGVLFPSFPHSHPLLFLLGIGKLMVYFSSPFKQLANGLEQFRPLFIMSICSNVIRAVTLLGFALLSTLDLRTVIIIFIAGDSAELILSWWITRKILKIPFTKKWTKRSYGHLMKESLPQAGVVIFTAAIARFDWILLGLLSSTVVLADYSFAFRVFEVTTLPLLVIAPILIPRFTRLLLQSHHKSIQRNMKDMDILLRLEITIASGIALLLNICWVPVIDFMTQGKYGFVNRYTIFILSLSMPFIYVNNFLWTLLFAKGQLREIFIIFFITFMVNMVGDIIFIPGCGGPGAALAYLIAMVLQLVLFHFKTPLPGLEKVNFSFLYPVGAMLGGSTILICFKSSWLTGTLSVTLFLLVLYVSKFLRKSDWMALRRITGR